MELKVEDLKRIKIASDECLLVKVDPKYIGPEQMLEMYDSIKEALPTGTKVLLYPKDIINLQVVKQL